MKYNYYIDIHVHGIDKSVLGPWSFEKASKFWVRELYSHAKTKVNPKNDFVFSGALYLKQDDGTKWILGKKESVKIKYDKIQRSCF